MPDSLPAASLATVLLLLGLPGSPVVGSDLPLTFDARISEKRSDLIELRRDLHRHPEVSGNEERTARVVAERLRQLGFEVTTGVGGHGVVGLLEEIPTTSAVVTDGKLGVEPLDQAVEIRAGG